MRAVIAVPYAWLAVFFLLPFVLVLAIALGSNDPDSAPPVALGFGFENFARLFTDKLYVDTPAQRRDDALDDEPELLRAREAL